MQKKAFDNTIMKNPYSKLEMKGITKIWLSEKKSTTNIFFDKLIWKFIWKGKSQEKPKYSQQMTRQNDFLIQITYKWYDICGFGTRVDKQNNAKGLINDMWSPNLWQRWYCSEMGKGFSIICESQSIMYSIVYWHRREHTLIDMHPTVMCVCAPADMYRNVHSSSIHSGTKLETHMCINSGLVK